MSLARPQLAQSALMIHTYSPEALFPAIFNVGQTGPTSQNYIAANVVVYIPFFVREAITITKLWWPNGAAVAGNIDVGVYNDAGTLQISTGTTVVAGISQVQTVDVTDTTIARGRYYLAIVSDTSGVTQKVMAVLPAAGIAQSLGLLEQAAVTLPLATNASPATFAKYTRAFIPVVGLMATRTITP